MKTKFLSIVIVAIIAIFAGVNINYRNTNVNLTYLSLENVVALAAESETDIKPGDACYNCGVYDVKKPKIVICAAVCYFEKRKLPQSPTTSICE